MRRLVLGTPVGAADSGLSLRTASAWADGEANARLACMTTAMKVVFVDLPFVVAPKMIVVSAYRHPYAFDHFELAVIGLTRKFRSSMPNSINARSDHTLIRKNWAKATLAGELLGQLFYERLFELAPASRAMFAEDIDDQARKLLQTLNWIIDHLDDPETLVPAAESLATRHVNYGVKAEHYPAVGEALIATLRQGLGSGFSAQDEAAWLRIYDQLSSVMTSAAYPTH